MAGDSRQNMIANTRPNHRVGQNHGPIDGGSRHARRTTQASHHAGDQRADGRGSGTDQVVPGEHRGPAFGGHDLGQRGLFDREERTNFIAAGTDHPDGGGHQQHGEIGGRSKGDPRGDHQQRTHQRACVAAPSGPPRSSAAGTTPCRPAASWSAASRSAGRSSRTRPDTAPAPPTSSRKPTAATRGQRTATSRQSSSLSDRMDTMPGW